jgi:hypothetical protein
MRFIQAFLASIAFIGYIIYHLVVKRKKVTKIKHGILTIYFFIAVWRAFIVGWVTNFCLRFV